MQAAPKPPMSRAQKLRWLTNNLIEEANAAEKAGNPDGAISKYLQAADILLLLAKVEQSYTAWKYYSDTAEQCQKRVKMLIATAPKQQASS